MESGKYLEVNDSFLSMLGYSQNEVIGKTSFDLGIWDNPGDRAILLQKLLEQKSIREEEVIFKAKSGKSFNVLIYSESIEVNGRKCLLSLTRDISQRKHLEKELRYSQYFIQRILDTTPNLLYIYDLVEQKNTYANYQTARFLGYSPEEIQEMGSALFANILHPDDAVRVAEHHKQLLESGKDQVLEIEYRMKHFDGQW